MTLRKPTVTTYDASITLDPSSEFEAALMSVVRMHREKSKIYGTEEDALWNFYDGAQRLNTTPLDVCISYATKHESALRRWMNGNRKKTKASDDAALDRAVYAILFLIIYKRGDYVR